MQVTLSNHWSDKINDLLLEIKNTVDDAKFIGHQRLSNDDLNKYSLDYQPILNDGLLNYPDSGLRKQSKGKNLLDRCLLSCVALSVTCTER